MHRRWLSLPLCGLLALASLAVAQRAASLADGDAETAAGTTIRSRAVGSFRDEDGNELETLSDFVTVTVAAVPALTVGPREEQPSARVRPREQFTRAFRVCNTGNVALAPAVKAASATPPAHVTGLHLDEDGDGRIGAGDTPLAEGHPLPDQLTPEQCVSVLAALDAGESAPGSRLVIRLSAGGDGAAAEGQIVNSVGTGARLTDPDDPDSPPALRVNGSERVYARAGEAVTYTLRLRNTGDADALDLELRGDLPPGLSYAAGSLTLDGRAVSDAAGDDAGQVEGGAVTLRAQNFAQGETMAVSFAARLEGAAEASGLGRPMSFAFRTRDGDAGRSSTAVAVVTPEGTVYAARGAGRDGVGQASLTLSSDPEHTATVALPAEGGAGPNARNENPFTTDASGRYCFIPPPNQPAASYYLRAAAPGFRTRHLRVDLAPAPHGLYAVAVAALDGLPAADRGESYALDGPRAAVSFDIPMYEARELEVTKLVDRQTASVGEHVTYTITARNPTTVTLREVTVHDRLPVAFNYSPNTARASGDAAAATPAVTPDQAGALLTAPLGTLRPGQTARLTYRASVGVNCPPGERASEATATAAFPNGDATRSAPARAGVLVTGGPFRPTQVAVGRVYFDADGDSRFGAGDTPVPGARVYLVNGNYAVTDPEGLYNFPALDSGPVVITLDPDSLPGGAKTAGNQGWARLHRTPLAGGTLLVQDFPLVPVKHVTAQAAKPNAETPHAANQQEADAPSRTPTPGAVVFLSPEHGRAVSPAAAHVRLRTAAGWKVALAINARPAPAKNIGETRTDAAAGHVTYTFVGLNLAPGPNRLRAEALDARGTVGGDAEISVMGRGPVTRLVVEPDQGEVRAGGRDARRVTVRALDAWGNPAADGPVTLEADGLSVARADEEAPKPSPEAGGARHPRHTSKASAHTAEGRAVFTVSAPGVPGTATLRASAGAATAEATLRVTDDDRRRFSVAVGEFTFGRAPESSLLDEERDWRGRLRLFYQGRVFGRNFLTLAYDSQQPLNRRVGRDRLFQLDPLERSYPLFGDTSTRHEEAPSNSKLYARLARGRSYLLFGDFETELKGLALAGYARKHTGVKLHLEGESVGLLSLTGASPDTAFARDVLPAEGLALARLSHADVVPGSETLTLEVRDRRNPEVVLSRETLLRSVDYNLDYASGEVFFLRHVSAFDHALNLVQVVAAYEYHRHDTSGLALTARASRRMPSLGLSLGLSYARVAQGPHRPFQLFGLDGAKELPRGGRLTFEAAHAAGDTPGLRDPSGTPAEGGAGGAALKLDYRQPLPLPGATLQASYSHTAASFINPFAAGGVTPGARRLALQLDLKPREHSTLRAALSEESNRTANVDNRRRTASLLWSEQLGDRLRLDFGYDLRSLRDARGRRDITSHLVTLGGEWRPTDKLQLSLRREQNLAEADPTYPTQTVLGASYQLRPQARLFFTQRISSRAIVPIADVAAGGFEVPKTRGETAAGIETRLGASTSLSARYELARGEDSADGFAVIGLRHRLSLSKQFAVDAGYERGVHLSGAGRSFNAVTLGATWQPGEDLVANFRYELRDRDGRGQSLTAGAAGRIAPGWTGLARFHRADARQAGRESAARDSQLALAWRPASHDRAGLLFSYQGERRSTADGAASFSRSAHEQLSADAYLRPRERLELYTRLAARHSSSASTDVPSASLLTLLTQTRAQLRLSDSFDVAGEGRWLFQPGAGSSRTSLGAEAGYWLGADVRLGLGYNLTRAHEPSGYGQFRRGFYFNVTTKLTNLFDLLGRNRAREGDTATGATKK